ncbi:MAG: NYN domain-containing protein [Candidatus Eisenbacteria bacterium]|uniref:NYN domain-containing protein n=1 Tax=Eiseniibacteriota bacterium TaxID=2212470 RepID=A0A933SG85_UNCEI|nr:NYN domain-containing protein [Candidatus Eisenbacteria bacterium]
MSTRTVFLVDGFNLYHSLCAARLRTGGSSTKWLDLPRLCQGLLSIVGGQAELSRVVLFSALARHREGTSPGTIERHSRYLDAMLALGVEVELGHFKRRPHHCSKCFARTVQYEEKETDVAIATTMLECFFEDRCEAVVLVSGDSDLAPAVRTARRLFPSRRVIAGFPYARHSDELKLAASAHFKLTAEHYGRCQLPTPLMTQSGRLIHKPAGW